MSRILGELYALPQRPGFVPLAKWPRARKLAEIARVDRRLAALAAQAPGEPAGPALRKEEGAPGAPGPQPIGALARRVEVESLRKYRRRLARAL